MVADKARKWTDKELSEMEKHIDKIYKQANEELTQKWNTYMSNAAKRIADTENKLAQATKNNDAAQQAELKKKLVEMKKNITLSDAKYKQMINDTTKKLAEVNQIAVAYANGQMPSVYTINYNNIKIDADKIGVDFTMADEHAVARLIKDGDIKLPKKKIDIPKDQRWNTKQLNSSVLQGILQGESMDKIAKRILPVVDNNKNASIRNARTMVTGAENAGRLDSYEDLQDEGAILKKVWMATADDRTREWHLSMDGQTVDIDEPFVDGNGNEIMFPGDPSAAPETVYNCRCTMVTKITGFRKSSGRTEKVDINPITKEHTRQINAQKTARQTLFKAEKEEKIVSAMLKNATKGTDAELAGYQYRLKSNQSLARKIMSKSEAKGLTYEEYSKQVTDVLRYTYVCDEKNLVSDFEKIERQLNDNNYTIVELTNTLKNKEAEYRGINMLVATPNDYVFELQYHTQESLRIKEINHKLYEIQRDAGTSEEKRKELGETMIKNASKIPTPPRVEQIENIKLEKKVNQW